MTIRDSSLAGRTAFVTGGGGGIGRAIALSLAARGANVVVAVRRCATGEETVRRINAEGGTALSIEADCREYDAIQSAVDKTVERFGGLDFMIHNAAYGHGPGITPLEEITDDHIGRMMDVALGGHFNTARTALPWLKQSNCARYIGMSSDFGLYATRVDAGYAGIKSAIRAFIKALAREWGQYGITVNAVSPAALSEGAEEFFAGNPGLQQEYYDKFALGQIGRPREDIAEAIAAMCGPEFGYMTGQTIVLDGGLYTGL